MTESGVMTAFDELRVMIREKPEEPWCDMLSVEDAVLDHWALWHQAELLFPDMTKADCAKVVSLVVGTCPGCYEDGLGCYCQADD